MLSLSKDSVVNNNTQHDTYLMLFNFIQIYYREILPPLGHWKQWDSGQLLARVNNFELEYHVRSNYFEHHMNIAIR